MKIVQRDLLEYIKEFDKNEYIIVHCISNDWALGAGIALQLKKAFYIRKPNYETSVGTCVFSPNFVANLITKSHYYKKPTYSSLEGSFISLSKQLQEPKILIMPKIGCGLDKLDWSKVSELIEKYLKTYDVRVCII